LDAHEVILPPAITDRDQNPKNQKHTPLVVPQKPCYRTTILLTTQNGGVIIVILVSTIYNYSVDVSPLVS